MCNPYRDQLFLSAYRHAVIFQSLKKHSFNRATNKETPHWNEQIQIMGQDN